MLRDHWEEVTIQKSRFLCYKLDKETIGDTVVIDPLKIIEKKYKKERK